VLTRTTTQILESLRDPANSAEWRSFDDRYRPVLMAFARRRGLSEADAADVAQTTLAQFVVDFGAGRYDRTRGRLSSWILGIARNRVADAGRDARRARERTPRGESALVDLAEQGAGEREWEEALRKVILERALTVLRNDTRLDERTIRAFDLCAMRNVPPAAAAAECGMTVAEVYVAKNRAIKKLREIVQGLTMEFDDS